MAALGGVILLVISRPLAILLIYWCPTLGSWWRMVSPWPFSGTAAISLVLGAVAPFAINKIKSLEVASQSAIQLYGNALDKLFFEATETECQVALTLETGKVYAGWLDWTPSNPAVSEAYVKILPTMSGYRTADCRVAWTTFYQKVYLQLPDATTETEMEMFTKVIPISQVVTAGLFDPEMYIRFNADQ